MGGGTSPQVRNDGFRVRYDGNTLASTTWDWAQNVNPTIRYNTVFRLRTLIADTVNSTKTNNYNNLGLEYNVAGAGWNAVTGTSPIQWSTSGNYADGDTITTAQITPISTWAGSFTNGQGNENDNTDGSYTLGNGTGHTVIEWALYADSAQLNPGQTVQVRVANMDTNVSETIVTLSFPQVQQGRFRWFADTAADPAVGDALAAENATPTLTGTQTMRGAVLRLRTQLIEINGADLASSALEVQWSVDGTNWLAIGNQAISTEDRWAYWWDSPNTTAGNTLGATRLTNSDASGTYHDNTIQNEAVNASTTREIDISLRVNWPPPNTTIKFRLTLGGDVVALHSTEGTEIRVLSCSAANRSYTIDRIEPADNATKNREFDGSMAHRIFWDGVDRYWIFGVQPDTGDTLSYWSWSGTGAWSSENTTAMGVSVDAGVEGQTRQFPAFKTIGSQPTFAILWNPGTGNTMRYRRGYVSSSAITWQSTINLGQVGYSNPCHVIIDDGDYHWIGGIDGTVPGVYAVRSTAADDGSTTFVPSFGTISSRKKTLSSTGVANSSPFAMVSIGSDEILAVWFDETNLQSASCTDAGGFTSRGQVNTTSGNVNKFDWGMVRSGDYVYLVYNDAATGGGGNYVLRVYTISTDTWSTGTTPGMTTISGAGAGDGIAVTADGDNIYAMGTIVDRNEGGVGREIQYKKYAGPGASGTWDTSISYATPNEWRGNADDVLTMPAAGSGKIIIGFTFGDSQDGTGQTLEYHVISVTSSQSVSMNSVGNITTLYNLQLTQNIVMQSLGSVTSLNDQQVTQNIAMQSIGEVTSLSEHAVTPGPVAVQMDSVGEVTNLNNQQVTQNIAMDAIGVLTTLYNPQVTQNVAMQSLGDVSALYDPQVVQNIAMNAIGPLTSLYDPSITQNVAMQSLGEVTSLYNSTVTPGAVTVQMQSLGDVMSLYNLQIAQNIVMDAISSVTSLYNPQVVQVITMNSIGEITTLYNHVVDVAGVQTVEMNSVGNTSSLFSPSATQNIAMQSLGEVTSLYQPSLSYLIQMNSLGTVVTLYDPAVAQVVAMQAISALTTLYGPSVTQNIAMQTISTITSLYNTTVAPGAVTIEMNSLGSVTTLYQHQVSAGDVIVMNSLGDVTTLYQPAVAPGAVTVQMNSLGQVTALYDPLVTQNIAMDSAGNISLLYQPAATPGPVSVSMQSLGEVTSISEPAVIPGAVAIELNSVGNVTNVYSPSASQIIALQAFGATTIFQPGVTPGAVTVDMQSAGSVTILYQLSVIGGVVLGTVTITETAAAGISISEEAVGGSSITTVAVGGPAVTEEP